MNDYIILKKDEDNYEVLETGFSYLAFIYGPLWAAFNLLWIPLFFGLFDNYFIHNNFILSKYRPVLFSSCLIFKLLLGLFGQGFANSEVFV